MDTLAWISFSRVLMVLSWVDWLLDISRLPLERVTGTPQLFRG